MTAADDNQLDQGACSLVGLQVPHGTIVSSVASGHGGHPARPLGFRGVAEVHETSVFSAVNTVDARRLLDSGRCRIRLSPCLKGRFDSGGTPLPGHSRRCSEARPPPPWGLNEVELGLLRAAKPPARRPALGARSVHNGRTGTRRGGRCGHRQPTDVRADQPDRRRQPRQWARVAPTYAEGFEALTAAAPRRRWTLAVSGRGIEMLDVGSGPGTLIGPALSRGASITAVDLTDEMVSEVRRRFPTVEARAGDASDLPFADQSFDAVTLGFCVHHMAEPGPRLDGSKPCLRPGGRIAFTVWDELERLEAFGVAFTALAELGLSDDDAPAASAPTRTAIARVRGSARAGRLYPSQRPEPRDWVASAGQRRRSSTASKGSSASLHPQRRAAATRSNRRRTSRDVTSRDRRHHLPSEPCHPRQRRQALLNSSPERPPRLMAPLPAIARRTHRSPRAMTSSLRGMSTTPDVGAAPCGDHTVGGQS